MVYYRVLLKKSVDKDLRKTNQVSKTIDAVRELAVNPFPTGSWKLRGMRFFRKQVFLYFLYCLFRRPRILNLFESLR